MRVSHPVCEQLNDPSEHYISTLTDIEIFIPLAFILNPESRHCGENDDDDQLEAEHCIKHVVHHEHQVADLSLRLLGIHHYFSFGPDIDHHSIAISDVPKETASQEQVVDFDIFPGFSRIV